MARTVIFDFDGVIARGDTMASLVRRRLLARPARAALALPVIPLWILLRGATSTRGAISRTLVRISCGGLTAAEYRALAEQHGTALGANSDWVIPAGVAAVRDALESGARVVITSGTEETLVGAFLAATGLADVPRIGSSLEFAGHRIRYRHHNFGERKAARLESEGWTLAGATLYTDSIADLDLAQRVGSTVLVGASRHDRDEFRRRIPALEIVSQAGDG